MRIQIEVPEVLSRFNLTMAEVVDPLKMASADSACGGEWRYTGAGVVAPKSKTCMLVKVGNQPGLAHVSAELEALKLGNAAQGQWRKAFKDTFPQPDGRGPIGFLDTSWVQDGLECFPSLYPSANGRWWEERWTFVGGSFYHRWRWVVVCK
jgi:hypothetical protein